MAHKAPNEFAISPFFCLTSYHITFVPCLAHHLFLVTAVFLLLLDPIKPSWFLPNSTCSFCICPSLFEMLPPNIHTSFRPLAEMLSPQNYFSWSLYFNYFLLVSFLPLHYLVLFSFTLLWVFFIELIDKANCYKKTTVIIFSTNNIYYVPGSLLNSLYLLTHLILCIT